MKIAMLEDDLAQASLVRTWLEEAGHSVTHYVLAADFLNNAKLEPFDLAILDWELPDGTGIETLQTLRKHEHNTQPILFATQRDSEMDVISALQAGADDYLVKPLRQGELLARIEVIRRRAGIHSPEEIIKLADIEMDTRNRVIKVAGEVVKVTQKDYDVALHLITNIGKVLSREYLLKSVWGVGAELNTRTVDMHVSRVRRSLKINPDMGYCIKTIYQHGYRLEKI